ncbi:MAG: DUF4910 domain-containing protein [Lentisphaeria bacterium]|nr:DUF4910 domain-containing protein [Lentisphaeria bacterium]
MKALYQEFLGRMDPDDMIRKTTELMHIEMGQTYRDYGRVVRRVRDLMTEAGIPHTEILEFPADGRTSFLDAVSPLAWDASVGRLTLLPSGEVAADYEVHPFHLIQGSVSTPPGGITAPIVTEDDFHAGADVRGAMVMLDPLTWPRAGILTPVLDRGGIGIISDFVRGRELWPDQLQWVVACSETSAWHVSAADRPFYGFSVKPETGDRIRANPSMCRIECDGRRYEGVLPMVTGLVPGRSAKELWIFAHLYEPMLDDDSIGVVTAIEAARRIMERGTPEHSLRLVFAMEYYGFAAYAQSRGENLKNEVVGGCNLDAVCCVKGEVLQMVQTGNAVPFAGNMLLHEAVETFKDIFPMVEIKGKYYDDIFLGDPTVGVPSTWIFGENGGFWHGSRQCLPDFIDRETYHKAAAIAAAYLCKWADYTGPLPQTPERPARLKKTPMRDYAAQTVFARVTPGFPKDQLRVPREERRGLPDSVIYGPFANLLANLDGRSDTARLIELAERETGSELAEREVKKYVDSLNFLCDHGYVKALRRPEITREDIAAALRRLGVEQGDLLLVHPSLSGCGYISGGAETLVSALTGAAETVLFPVFTRSWVNAGGVVNRSPRFRPASSGGTASLLTGAVAKHILQHHPEFARGSHVTHAWAGTGSRAAACIADQSFDAPPAGADSAPRRALEFGGKVLYFGTGLDTSFFLHCLEDHAGAPYLAQAVCQVRDPSGAPRAVIVPDFPSGHREFYRPDAENSKFFTRAVQCGLDIREVSLGIGKLRLIDLEQLFGIGTALLKEDPRILLCDDPDCAFCRSAAEKAF